MLCSCIFGEKKKKKIHIFCLRRYYSEIFLLDFWTIIFPNETDKEKLLSSLPSPSRLKPFLSQRDMSPWTKSGME